jgi:hypothetical protein
VFRIFFFFSLAQTAGFFSVSSMPKPALFHHLKETCDLERCGDGIETVFEKAGTSWQLSVKDDPSPLATLELSLLYGVVTG